MQSLVGPFTIKDRLAEDLAAASPLPGHRFEPCVIHPAVGVDKYPIRGLRRQSLQRPPAVRVRDGDGQGLRRPGRDRRRRARSSPRTRDRSEKQTMILDPLHYLATLGRKPGALDHAPVFRDWKLPACFADFRAGLERQHGPGAGARQYARVLQLLAEHPLTRLSKAIEICLREQLDTAEAVIRRTRIPRGDRGREASRVHPTPSESSAMHPGRRAAARPEPVQPAPERPTRRQPGQRVLRLTRFP